VEVRPLFARSDTNLNVSQDCQPRDQVSFGTANKPGGPLSRSRDASLYRVTLLNNLGTAGFALKLGGFAPTICAQRRRKSEWSYPIDIAGVFTTCDTA